MSLNIELKAFILAGRDGIRNPKLLQDLEVLGIEFEIIPFIDPALAIAHLEREKRQIPRRMNQGELACSYGHLLIYGKILGEEGDAFLVLEDDASLNPYEFKDLIFGSLNLPNHIFLLGSCGGTVRSTSLILSGKQFYRLMGSAMVGSHAYLINKSVARELYDANLGLKLPADAFRRGRNIDIFIQFPYSATQMKARESLIERTPQIQEIFVAEKTSALKLLCRDIMDLRRTGRFGARLLERLTNLSLISRRFHKLPGCRD